MRRLGIILIAAGFLLVLSSAAHTNLRYNEGAGSREAPKYAKQEKNNFIERKGIKGHRGGANASHEAQNTSHAENVSKPENTTETDSRNDSLSSNINSSAEAGSPGNNVNNSSRNDSSERNLTREAIIEYLLKYDYDRDGFFDRVELERAVEPYISGIDAIELREGEIVSMISHIDEDGDGKISLQEMIQSGVFVNAGKGVRVQKVGGN